MSRDTKTKDLPLDAITPDELFNALPTPKKLSRAGHPETSKEGAREVMDRLPDLYREVLALVNRFPGCTASELAAHAGHRDPRHVGRRLPEMVRLGVITRDESVHPCAVTGRRATRWWPK